TGRAGAVRPRLRVAPKPHAPTTQSLQGLGGVEGGAKASVQFPAQDHVQSSLRGPVEQISPGRPTAQVGGAGLVYEFPNHDPSLARAEFPQRDQLRLDILVLVGRADPGVYPDPHDSSSPLSDCALQKPCPNTSIRRPYESVNSCFAVSCPVDALLRGL